jgi:putative FmdB family regulatory protein
MPFYEYQCRACGEQTEVMQKISDKPLRKCPACGKSALVKLISAPVFRLKGSGWYETDFKSDQDKKRNLAADDKAAEPSKPAETAAEKPAAEKPATDKAAAKPDAKSTSKTKPKPKAKLKSKSKSKGR